MDKPDFPTLFRQGRNVSCGWLLLKVQRNGGKKTRFACAIRRGVLQKAVQRNRMKRWLREAYRRHREQFPPGLDLAAVVTRLPEESNFSTVEEALLLGCRQLQQKF